MNIKSNSSCRKSNFFFLISLPLHRRSYSLSHPISHPLSHTYIHAHTLFQIPFTFRVVKNIGWPGRIIYIPPRECIVYVHQSCVYVYIYNIYREIPLTRYKLMAAAVTKASLRFLNCSEHMAPPYIYIYCGKTLI